MTALLLSLFFAMASNTMVLTGLPQIIADLHGTATQYTWIVTTSLLLLAVTTPVWGRLAERYSPTRLLMISLTVYFFGSVGAGAAFDPWMIVACRALIGAGAGGIVTLVQLIVTRMTTPQERPKYFGAIGSVMSVAAVIAPALGGVVVDLGGWRWVFFSTAPLAIVAFLMVWLWAPPVHLDAHRRGPFDVLGTVMIAVAVTAIMVWLTFLHPPVGAAGIITGIIAVALIAGAVIAERRASAPLVPPALLKNRNLVKVLICSGVAGVAAFGTSVYLAMYLQDVRGLTAGETGLLLIPLSAATFTSSLAVGWLVSRTGRDKGLLLFGVLAIVVGYAVLTLIQEDTPLVLVVCAGATVSLGVGAVTQQIVATGQRYLRPEDLSVGSALILFLRSVITVICLSAFGVVLAFASAGESGELGGIRAVFAACLVVGVAGLIAVAALPNPLTRRS
ncbi:MDR family MFS transporter [Microbacterium sediminicola]|uniref:MDR family MFS transporter n=2 Tax=Microbacterium sediminicola TaxID=415210 RepID=A0ABP4ULJ5_9MICO